MLQNLFKDYNPLERPVEVDNAALNVSIGLALQQIVDVDEKKQVIHILVCKHSCSNNLKNKFSFKKYNFFDEKFFFFEQYKN